MIILEKPFAGLNAAALERFVRRARRAAGLSGSVNIVLTGSARMRALNLRFRKKNKATDVLSFPAKPYSNGTGLRALAGEIVISADVAAANAAKLGHSLDVEVKVLVLHGILHLAGYDHERDNGKMARKEARLRRALMLPSSLTERSRRGEAEIAVRPGIARSRRSRSTA